MWKVENPAAYFGAKCQWGVGFGDSEVSDSEMSGMGRMEGRLMSSEEAAKFKVGGVHA